MSLGATTVVADTLAYRVGFHLMSRRLRVTARRWHGAIVTLQRAADSSSYTVTLLLVQKPQFGAGF